MIISKLNFLQQRIMGMKMRNEILQDKDERTTEENTGKLELSESQREQVLSVLEKHDYISKSPDGKIIVDLDKINDYSTHIYAEEYRDILKITKHGGFFVLQHAFDGIPVISKSDWENKTEDSPPAKKDLFYNPKSDKESLDPYSIREADFYISPWKGTRSIDFPHLGKTTSIEAITALLVYSPKYGDGIRDSGTGRLLIKDQDTKKYKPITHDFFKKYNFTPTIKLDGRKLTLPDSPAQFLKLKGQHLIESGILTTEDFKQTGSQADKTEPFSEKPIKSGFAYIDKIRYYVGKTTGDSKAVLLDKDTALVVSNGEIVSYFRLKPELRKAGKGALTVLNAASTGLTRFDRESFLQPFEDEDEASYQSRIDGLKQYESKQLTQLALEKYPEIIETIEEVRGLILEVVGKDDRTGKLTNQIIQSILRRSRELLTRTENDSREKVINGLLQIKKDSLLLASAFKELRSEVSLENFINFQISSSNGGKALDESTSKIMLAIAERNWRGQNLHDEVISSFKKALASEESQFYIAKYKNKVVGFLRLEPTANGKLHFASFNIDQNLEGAKIGMELLRTIFQKEAEGKTVEAEADPISPITSRYIQDFGFVATEVMPYGSANEAVFKIEKNPEAVYKYQGKKYHELVIECEGKDSDINGALFRQYTFPNDTQKFRTDYTNFLANNHYVISAYSKENSSREEDNGKNFIVVYEPRKEQAQAN